jgi:hypothetical protein
MTAPLLTEHDRADLARCDREIAEIRNLEAVRSGQTPAWLVMLGIEDWEMEKRLILKAAAKANRRRADAAKYMTVDGRPVPPIMITYHEQDRRIRAVMWGKSGRFCFYQLDHVDAEEFFQEALPRIRATLGAAVDQEATISSAAVRHLRFKPMPEREAVAQGQRWGVKLEKRPDRGYPVTAIFI